MESEESMSDGMLVLDIDIGDPAPGTSVYKAFINDLLGTVLQKKYIGP